MSMLPELERQLNDAATGAGRGAAGAPGPRRRWRRIAALAVVVPVLGGVAWAADLWPTGTPIKPQHTFKATEGVGVPIAETIAISDVTVPDPAGGPVWGLRTLRTTRGYGCVQIGRLVDGKLGLLGTDGAFADDGRFHELMPDDLSRGQCQPLDAKGQTFLAIGRRAIPASASDEGCVMKRFKAPPKRLLDRLSAGERRELEQFAAVEARRPLCKTVSLRTVYYGLLGSEATKVSHRGPDGKVIERAVGAGGAYLFVDQAYARSRRNLGFAYGVTPSTGLVSISYRDGSTCRLASPPRWAGGAMTCPAKGYVAADVALPSAKDVATKVSARIVSGGKAGRALRLRFRAPVDTKGVGLQYTVEVRYRRGCGGSGITVGPIGRDISAGEAVTEDQPLPLGKCHVRLTGAVYLADFTDANRAWTPPILRRSGEAVLVGRFSVMP